MIPAEIVNSSSHFNIIMNVIKKKYPYVVGYDLSADFEEKWEKYEAAFFVELILSESKVKEFRPNWERNFWVDSHMEKYGTYESPFLSTIFDVKDNESGPSPSEDSKGIENTMNSLHYTKHIPGQIKIQKEPMISGFILTP